MRRLARWLFTLCCLLSLALCLATTAVWVHWHEGGGASLNHLAYRRDGSDLHSTAWNLMFDISGWTVSHETSWLRYSPDPDEWDDPDRRADLIAILEAQVDLLEPDVGWTFVPEPMTYGVPGLGSDRPPGEAWEWGGFGYGVRNDVDPPSPDYHIQRTIWCPAWAPPVLFALPAMSWAASAMGRRRRARRIARGLCPSCGYDLRATPGRCPEMFSPLQRADLSFFAPC